MQLRAANGDFVVGVETPEVDFLEKNFQHVLGIEAIAPCWRCFPPPSSSICLVLPLLTLAASEFGGVQTSR